METLLEGFVPFFSILIIAYFLIVNVVYLLLSFLGFPLLRKYSRSMRVLEPEELTEFGGAPPISLILPAYNEEKVIAKSVRSSLSIDYPDFEVIVVNDGSQDGTIEVLKRDFDLKETFRRRFSHMPVRNQVEKIYQSQKNKRLWVLDKPNGGKGESVNCALNFCGTPYICTADADTLIEKDAFIRAIRPFIMDSRTIAAGGVVRIANGSVIEVGAVKKARADDSWLTRVQIVEYFRAFLAGRLGWASINSSLIISGAFAFFRRDVLIEAGGFDIDTITEDMEVIIRLHRHCRETKRDYKITFIPDTLAWTECPSDFKSLSHQRSRWQHGLLESIARHRVMLFNPRYGPVGMIALPYFYLFELFGPVIELGGYFFFITLLIFGIVSIPHAVFFFTVAVLLGIVLSVASITLAELTIRRYENSKDLIRLMVAGVIENFGFRQLLTVYRVNGMINFPRRRRKWGRVERRGFPTGRREEEARQAS